MISLSGQLTVKTIRGRNGDFNVGMLKVEEGEFSVKNTILDEYDEGKYDGTFMVSHIFPFSYVSYGKVVIEVRVNLHGFVLDDVEGLSEADNKTIIDPDPVDELPQQEAGHQIIPFNEIKVSSDTTSDEHDDSKEIIVSDIDPDKELFGYLYPLGETVKLDKTVDRTLFRNQRTRLKEMGYKFNFQKQVWSLDD